MTVRKYFFKVIALAFILMVMTGNLLTLFDQSQIENTEKRARALQIPPRTLDFVDKIRGNDDRKDDDWPMFCRDMAHASRSYTQPPLYPDLLWSFNMKELNPVQGDIYSTPIVIGNTVFACSNNFYMASFNIDNGSKNWHIWLEGEIYSTPVYSDGFLYVGASNKLWKVNASTGNKESIFTVDTKIYSSPAIYNDTIFFGTMYNNSNLYAVSLEGKELWNVSFGVSLRGAPASPAIHNGTVFIGCDNGKLYALDHDGLLDGDQGVHEDGNNTTADILWIKDIGSSILASPTIIPGAVIVSTFNETGTNFMYSFALDDGDELWNNSVSGKIQSTAAFDPDTNRLYVGTYGGSMIALDSGSGTPIWSFNTYESIQSSPAIAGEMVFFGGFDRKIWALDAAGNGDGTTSELWNYTTEAIIHSSPAISNGRLFIGSDDDKLYCIGAPDFSIRNGNINISDKSPYVGENISIEIGVSNLGTVASDVDLTVTASDVDFTTNHTLGRKRVRVEKLSNSTFFFNWTVLDNTNNLWKINAELDNSVLTETRFQNNNATTLIAFKREIKIEWPMAGGNSQHWGYSPKGTLTNRTLWQKDIGSELLSPIIYKERAIIVNKSGHISSVYINLDGTVSWEADFSSLINYPIAAGYDKIFVPLEDRLIALDINGFEDGNTGILSEKNTDIGDADIIWEYKTPISPTAPPTVANGSVFLARGNVLTSFDEDNGKVLFNVSMPGNVENCAPSVSGELVLMGSTNGRIFAFNRFNGSHVWTYETNLDSHLSHSLTIISGTVIFPRGDRLQLLDLDSMKIRWSLPVASNITTSAAYSPESDSIYFGSEAGKFYMVSPKNGEISMTLNVSSAISTDISMGGDVAYFATIDNRIFAVTPSDNSKEGKICWSFLSESAVTESIAVSEMVLATTVNGKVYCFGAPNSIPIARISLPVSGSTFFTYETIAVNASYSSDSDGDILQYTWSSDIDGELYRGDDGSTFIRLATPGLHNITLMVDDGQGGRDSSSLWVHVYKSTILSYHKENFESNWTISLVTLIGGKNASMALDFTGNPSNVTGRDIEIFLNITRKDIALMGWMNFEFFYDEKGFPYGLNQSYLSIYYFDIVTGWVEIPGESEIGTNRIRTNITGLPYSYASTGSTVIAVGTFSNTNPLLSSPSVSPLSGPSDGNFNFTVLYLDQDGDFPNEIYLIIDNSTRLYMRPGLAADLNVRDGKEYYYLLQGLPVGNHSFRFEAHDRIIGVQTVLFKDLVSLDPRPRAVLDLPINGSIFQTGEKVIFDATGSIDPDDEPLNYSWIFTRFGSLSINYSHTTDKSIYTREFTEPGLYVVTLRVYDGSGHISDNTTIVIEIIDRPEQNGSEKGLSIYIFSAAGLIVILLIFVTISILRKRGKAGETEIPEDDGTVESENEEEPKNNASNAEEKESEEKASKLAKEKERSTKSNNLQEGVEMVCIACGSEVSSSDSHCPHCTEELIAEGVEDIGDENEMEAEDDLKKELEHYTGGDQGIISEEELLAEDEHLEEMDEEDLLDESDE